GAEAPHTGAGRPPEGRVRRHPAPRPEGPEQPPRGARPRGRGGRPARLGPGGGPGETEGGRRGPRGYDPGPGGRGPRGEGVREGPRLREGRPRRGPGGVPLENRPGGVREPPARRGGHPHDGRRGDELRRDARRARQGDRRERPSDGEAARVAGPAPGGVDAGDPLPHDHGEVVADHPGERHPSPGPGRRAPAPLDSIEHDISATRESLRSTAAEVLGQARGEVARAKADGIPIDAADQMLKDAETSYSEARYGDTIYAGKACISEVEELAQANRDS